jgi:hypothetical protein
MDDPRRFNFGTPKEAWNTMVRCWEIEPTSKRIIADVMDFPNVLKIVIEHEGAVVPEINFRHGHRAQAINGGRVLKHKVSRRQRKHLLTMGPIHPDAQEALDKLLAIGRAEQPLDEEEIAHAMDEEDEALIAIDQADLNSDDEDDIDNENDDLELNVALFAVFASQNQFF